MKRGEVSDTILIIGVLVLVSITVLTAFISLDRIEIPEDSEQEISGDNTSVSTELAELVDACWKKSGRGQLSNSLDCFNVKIFSNGSVNEDIVEDNLRILDQTSFSLSSPIASGESTVKISYRPVSESINISSVNSCRPGSGDTCYSVACTCETVCGPKFDPNGDGVPETDNKGCITDYSFSPTSSPCSTLSCGNPSIYNNLSYSGSTLRVDSDENISLSNVTLKKLPTASPSISKILKPEKRLSPFEVVGSGSKERKLFKGEAALNISSLTPGDYGLYLWSCKEENVIQDCSWQPYNFTVS